jgi:hypothetical protein
MRCQMRASQGIASSSSPKLIVDKKDKFRSAPTPALAHPDLAGTSAAKNQLALCATWTCPCAPDPTLKWSQLKKKET